MNMDGDSEFFRASVGALIVRADGKLLAFARAAGHGDEWQLPQGGLSPGEDTREAVYREILEETAITADRLVYVDQTEEWVGYELPESYRSAKTRRGQVHKWFVFRFEGTDQDIRPDNVEFKAWRWMRPEELLPAAASFRRPVYQYLFRRFLLGQAQS
jgi:putative (di)nucleoside polyphosphate hydrolase